MFWFSPARLFMTRKLLRIVHLVELRERIKNRIPPPKLMSSSTMEASSSMEDMVKMLADAPEDQRRKMVADRFTMIAAMPEIQRTEAVKGILVAVSKLDPKKKKDFIRTRTNVMVDSSPETRKAIQTARVKAGALVPEEVNQSDMMTILEVCQEWPREKHQMFLSNLEAVFKELGMKMPDVDAMMKTMAKAREEMKKPRWKFW